MTRPVVGVLALQGDVREHLAALEAVGARAIAVRRASELADVDGLVIPGGESTAMSRLARVFDLVQPVRAAIAGGLPAYGSCAGMIMLADRVLDGRADHEGFGGLDITVRRNAFGRQVDSFEVDLAMSGLEAPVRAVFIRAPSVDQVGPAVEVLARIGAGADAAGTIVAVRQGDVLATSFHPELTGDLRIHASFVTIVEQRRTA